MSNVLRVRRDLSRFDQVDPSRTAISAGAYAYPLEPSEFAAWRQVWEAR